MVKTIKLRKNISYLLTTCIIFAIGAISQPLSAQNYKVQTVVLDAGHGGNDPGAKGAAGSYEKYVALQVVLLLGKKIEAAFSDVKVIYTRKTDVFIPLHERASIANRNKADLFISVHCNASTSRSPYGTETFTLGPHKSDEQYEVAKRENAVIALEKNTEDMYGGYDPNAPETMILLQLGLNANMEQSMLFANKIQDQYTNKLDRFNRGVKQAGFAVLYRTTMPSVLTELGFISNVQEEKYLVSPQGQEELAEGLFQAFKTYKHTMENTKGSSLQSTAPTIPVEEPKPVASENKPASIPASTIPPVEPKPAPTPTVNNSSSIIYKVQIAVTSQMINIKQAPYNSIRTVTFDKQGNLYKYMAGNYSNYNDVKGELEKMKNLGFKDAFIVVYKQGVRLNTAEAKTYLQ